MRNKKISNPYFTIITVVKNDDVNIKKTIRSICKQTYKNFELIVVSVSAPKPFIDKYFDTRLYVLSK